MRRNWLASGMLTAAALSVPVAGAAGTAHAATTGSRQTTVEQKTHTKQHKLRKHHKARKQHRGRPSDHKKTHYAGRHRHRLVTLNQRAATIAKTLEGDPYEYGGTTPAGFDCSGLTQYVYHRLGKRIQRTAEDQFLQFRRISHRSARPGDLVFFHATSDPNSYVYHVGVFEGGDKMVAATTWGQGVQYQDYDWAGNTVTFGTITH